MVSRMTPICSQRGAGEGVGTEAELWEVGDGASAGDVELVGRASGDALGVSGIVELPAMHPAARPATRRPTNQVACGGRQSRTFAGPMPPCLGRLRRIGLDGCRVGARHASSPAHSLVMETLVSLRLLREGHPS